MPAFEHIRETLAAANQAILAGRPREAVTPLSKAHDLLAARIADDRSFSAIITVQAALMALLAGAPELANRFAVLVVEEVGRSLEELVDQIRRQQARGEREAAYRALIVAYAYAVTFLPFIADLRLREVLPGGGGGDDVVAGLEMVRSHVRPKLDTAGWARWPYPRPAVERAKSGALYALIQFAGARLDNLRDGRDVEFARQAKEAAEALLQERPEDEVTFDYWNLASRVYFHYGSSHFADAARCAEQAIRLGEALGKRSDTAVDRANLGALYVELAGFQEADGDERAAECSLRLAEDHLGRACAELRALGNVEALVKALSALAPLYAKRKAWDRVEAATDEAWQALSGTGAWQALLTAAIAGNFGSTLLEQGRHAEAETWLRRGLDALAHDPSPDAKAFILAHGTLGRVLTVTGRQREGYQHLRLAVGKLEDYRTSFIAERTSLELLKLYRWTYEALVQCCVALGEGEPGLRAEAFDIVERGKWRLLTVFLRYLPLGLLDPTEEPLIAEEEDLLRRAQTALAEPAGETGEALPELFRRLDAIWRELEPRHPQYVAFRRQRTVTAGEARSLLDDRVPVLVEYYLGDDYGTAIALVIRRDRSAPESVPLATTPAALAGDVARLRAEPDSGAPAAFQAVSRQLHRTLIAPLLPLVAEGEGLCIVPHGVLHNLPFAALHDGTRYLIERNPLVISPTAGALRWWIGKDRGASASCLILAATGGTWIEQERQSDLVLFEDLARRQLAPLFADARFVTGGAATKARLLAELAAPGRGWDVLHVACHGVAQEDALQSFLVMAGDPGADHLTALEIATEVRPHATLVTLSACESAVAETSTGDEVAGLTHAFLMSGASSVLASLCRVRQDAGVAVTGRFYELWKGSRDGVRHSKIRALQLAQQEALQRRGWFGLGGPVWHPRQWSAFQLYGNWN